MSIESFKIKDEDIKTHGVQSVGDTLTGSAAQNKAVFDRLIKDCVRTQFNALIDKLVSDLGASSIGMTDLFGENNKLSVFTATEKLKNHIESFYTLNEVSESHIKNVTFDEKTGIFSFERENGEVITLNTRLEKIAVNFEYDSQNEKLILTLIDGTKQEIPLTALISFTDFDEGDTIAFSDLGNNSVKAEVKNGSITDAHLSSKLKEDLESKVTTASGHADEALAAQTGAETAQSGAEKAQGAAEKAQGAAEKAQGAAEKAQGAAETAKSGAEKAQGAAEKAQGAAEKAQGAAEEACNKAVEIAGFDYSQYVKHDEYATATKAGVFIWGGTSNGLNMKGGKLMVYPSTEEEIDEKSNSRKPITPAYLDYAVKSGLTENKYTLTDKEKSTIANWLGCGRIVTGSYDGVGLNSETNTTTVLFAVDFSPSIVVLICPETDGSDFASFAVFFKALKASKIYWEFADDSVSKKRVDYIYYADDEDERKFKVDFSDNHNYSIQDKTYYYIAIGNGE